MKCLSSVRALAAISLAGFVAMLADSAVAQVPVGGVPVTVDVTSPSPPSARPSARSAPEGDTIRGVRIEDNGALITGPLNARRVYIPLDSADLPPGFTSLWVGEADLCPSAIEADRQTPSDLPDGVLRIDARRIVARQTVDITQLFVPLPSSFTLEMLQSGRRLILPASSYLDARKVLAIFTESDGERGYMELELLDDGDRLRLETHSSNETGLRCRS